MKYIKKIAISILIILMCTLTLTFIITFLNYNNIINTKTTSILKIIIIIFSTIIAGYYLGKKVNKNGYLEGIKLGIITVILLFFINIVIDKINIKDIIFYTLLIISSIIGSMLGINMKKNN